MKTRIRIGVLIMAALLALSTCNLFDQINIRWAITGYGLSGSLATVYYDVWNDGKFDLSGVNLEVAAYVSPAGVYKSAWTLPDFSLARNETKSGSYSFSISPYSSVFGDSVTGAAILGVDMDKPNG